MVVLAPQELVDCKGDKSRRNGCNGGMPSSAYNVIKSLGGMEAEADYRYTAKNGNCQFQKSKVKVKVTSYQSVGRGSETEMKKYVGSTGPLSVCGDCNTWRNYHGGILTSCGRSMGHCYQIVGYGEENGVAYWKVRNSWGTGFGEQGYVRIKLGQNLCAINKVPTKTVTASADESVVV